MYSEQLNPYIINPPDLNTYLSSRSMAAVDETHIIPLLLAYNGEQLVSDEGLIIYQFKELMNTANETSLARYSTIDRLSENDQSFSLCSPEQLTIATGLGIFNFIGLNYIARNLKYMSTFSQGQLQYVTLLKLSPVLIGYSFLYLAIPLARFIITTLRNRERNRRNQNRQLWANWLKSETGKEIISEKEKAKEKAKEKHNEKYPNNNDIYYSTKRID